MSLLWLAFDPWPTGFPHALGEAKKKKRKRRASKTSQLLMPDAGLGLRDAALLLLLGSHLRSLHACGMGLVAKIIAGRQL